MTSPKKSALEQIREHTVIVADTGLFEDIAHFRPTDVTTNPSLLLQAADSLEYAKIEEEAVKYAISCGRTESETVSLALDKLFVFCGREMLKVVPGRVSTEIDARLSFDTEAQVSKARAIVRYYEDEGIPKERVLIKLSSTWEGIRAAEILERDYDIRCNMTLLFNFHQAVACAEAGATLISPYVGRIYDWHVKNTGKREYDMLEDPGVVNVTRIYNYYKNHGYKTQVMGASFRNTDQVKGLCGCDYLTISPVLLEKLAADYSNVNVQLKYDKKKISETKPSVQLSEKLFRRFMNDDAMATDLISNGIRIFSSAAEKLEKILLEKIRVQQRK